MTTDDASNSTEIAKPICDCDTILSDVLTRLGYAADHSGPIPGVSTILRGDATWRGTASACWAWLIHTGQVEWVGELGRGASEELARIRDSEVVRG